MDTRGRHSSGPIKGSQGTKADRAECGPERQGVERARCPVAHVRTGAWTPGVGAQGEMGDAGCALSPEPWEALHDSLSWLGAQVRWSVGSVHTSFQGQ